MYMPPAFVDKDLIHARRIVREHPFASLISNDDAGFPFVTHLPIHLVDAEVEPNTNANAQANAQVSWRLLGHCAKGNPHGRFLRARPEALVTFLGPHAYLSPSVYPDLVRVPTWNYLAVHCRVQARMIDDPADKDTLLKCLIGDHEPAYAAQWRGLDASYTEKMLAGIVGFELRVLDVQSKLKLNQHRPEAHAATYQAYRQGDANAQALAQWIERLGLTGGSVTD